MKKKTANILISVIGLTMVGGIVLISLRDIQRAVIAQPPVTKELVAETPTPAAEKPIGSTKPTAGPKQAHVPQNTSGYADGTYAATATYGTPESIESIAVTLTLKNGVVAASSIDQSGNARESRRYQNHFAAGYQQYVVGQSVADLRLTRVSGSSLTPRAFNDAVSQIRAEARA